MHDNDRYLMTARYLCHLPMIILQSPNVIHHMGTRMKGIVCRFPMISIYGDGNTAFPQNHRQKYFHSFYFFFCRERLTAGTCRFRPYINNVRAGICHFPCMRLCLFRRIPPSAIRKGIGGYIQYPHNQRFCCNFQSLSVTPRISPFQFSSLQKS